MSDLPILKAAPPTKITVLISGSGTNLGKLIEATQSGLLAPHQIIRVIGNRNNVEGRVGRQRAKDAGIPTEYFNMVTHKYHEKGEKDPSVLDEARRRYDADLAKKVLADGPDLVVCGKFCFSVGVFYSIYKSIF